MSYGSDLQRLLPPSISEDETTKAFVGVLSNALSAIDTKLPSLLYNLDMLSTEQLELLAWQFHVEGWELAATIEDKRQLVRNAILLHRKKGTPYAIKKALSTVLSIEYESVHIEEAGADLQWDDGSAAEWFLYYDGTHYYNGLLGNGQVSRYGANGVYWALFRVEIDITSLVLNGIEIVAELGHKLRQIILDYKNARSHLTRLDLAFHLRDEMDGIYEDVLCIEVLEHTTYNGTYIFDGTLDYSGDHITLTMIL